MQHVEGPRSLNQFASILVDFVFGENVSGDSFTVAKIFDPPGSKKWIEIQIRTSISQAIDVLRGGCKCCLFSLLFGKDFHFTNIFQMG